MENIKQCAVIVRRPEDLWEGTRTSLGLAAHNYQAHLYVLDFTVEMTEALEDNLDWFAEMECDFFSDVEANSTHGFKILSLEQIAVELNNMDLIIPFGNRNCDFSGDEQH